MFVVPDDILEELTCDFCYKYLSVGPVKVDKNNKRKCGRCAYEGDSTGPMSVYQHFMESVTFKCINRFYGCNKILTHKEVIQHEKECLSKKQQFPFSSDEKMETYTYLYQFRKEHNKHYLKKPILKTTLNEIETENQFIYIKDNYIFFIFIEFNTFSKKLSFDAYYMGGGDKANIIQQNYMVEINGKSVHSIKQQPCLHIEKYNVAEWKAYSIQVDDQLLNESEVLLYLDFLIPLVVTKKMVSIPPIVTKEGVRLIQNYSIERPMSVHHKIIPLSEDNERISVVTMQGVEIEVKPECKVCSNISRQNIYITNSGQIRQLICTHCILGVKENFFLASNISENIMSSFDFISFSCLWNCGGFYSDGLLRTHEISSCKNRPHLKCPIQDCYFNGFFFNLKTHLDEHETPMFDRYVILDSRFNGEQNSYNISPKTKAFCIWSHPKYLIHCQVFYYSKGYYLIIPMFADKSIQGKNEILVMEMKENKNIQNNTHRGQFYLYCTSLPVKLMFIVVPIV